MAEYIDKEQVIEWFRPYGHMDKGIPYYGLVTDVREMKVADVAPVRHGRWDGNDCTVCKLPWNYNMVQDADDWGYFDPMPDYCPNCGAKMDGDEE